MHWLRQQITSGAWRDLCNTGGGGIERIVSGDASGDLSDGSARCKITPSWSKVLSGSYLLSMNITKCTRVFGKCLRACRRQRAKFTVVLFNLSVGNAICLSLLTKLFSSLKITRKLSFKELKPLLSDLTFFFFYLYMFTHKIHSL